jgi:hypothetical protein
MLDLICYSIQTGPDEELVHIYYSALNFKDVMTATGKLTSKPPKRRLDLVRTHMMHAVEIHR